MPLEAIALGFSTGTYCTMYCAPVLLPILFSTEIAGHRRNAGLTGIFLAGRFLTYVILGLAFSALGILAGEFFDPVFARKLSAIAYIGCGISMLFNSRCRCNKLAYKKGSDWIASLVCGLSVGLHICPPLWTALFRSFALPMSGESNSSGGFFYLIFFYLGSLPFFIPLLGIPFLQKRHAMLKRIASVTKILMGFYFVFMNGLFQLLFH